MAAKKEVIEKSIETNALVPSGWELPRAIDVKKDMSAADFHRMMKSSKDPNRQRGLVFENEKQRNAMAIRKGLSKPGKISYDTLRRIAMSVYVARICINSMKSKITKTEWVIQNIDQLKRKQAKDSDKRIEELEEFFRHPNGNNETFRTLLDKMCEDLLVLDAVSLEKTRYDDGTLAELYFVDSATIRPVYDEYGNQDIEIPLKTKGGEQVLPVSYLQVMNNSQYGGPESGDIVAAWPKKDFIHFNMHPQGSMEGFGYGLCVPGNVMIDTDIGKLRISAIVKQNLRVKVKSFNSLTGETEYREIVNWYSRKYNNKIYYIEFADGGKGKIIRCTDDHPILTGKGYIKAKNLLLSDTILVESYLPSLLVTEALYASLLGDSILKVHKKRKHIGYPTFAVAHSEKQKEYADWWENTLEGFGLNINKVVKKSPNSDNLVYARYLQTKGSPYFWNVYNDCYVDGKKYVTRKWLDKIGKFGLAVLLMDDGYISKDSHITLCTDSFSTEECMVIIQWLEEKFGLKARIRTSPSYPLPRLMISPYKKVLEIIKPYIRMTDRKGNPKLWIAENIKQQHLVGVVPLPIKKIHAKYDWHKRWLNKTVYDIEVEGNHNFLVNGAVVHNSPLEGVLSIVSNLLNSDNFNSTYFEEGAFPPIILNIVGSVNQRDMDAFKEYFYQELSGNFHRPALLASQQKSEVINLKDFTNRDMQFMEYTLWLAKMLCAAYEMSPQDIGITDDVNRATAEVQKDISLTKGYGSILNLLKQIFNQEIIWKDFGYDDLEFEWAAEDASEPDMASQLYDRALRNGSMTLNEVRLKLGEAPYEEWADKPMVLAADGYHPVLAEDGEQEGGDKNKEAENAKVIGGEEPYKEQETKDIKGETAEKVQKAVLTQNGFKTYADDRGVSQPFIFTDVNSGWGMVIKPPVAVNLQSQELEITTTAELARMGLNVKPVKKITYVDLIKSLQKNPEVLMEFDKYCHMTTEYDSEKWRAKYGGSRKFAYYLVTEFINGFALSNPLLIADMKRDPDSYAQAARDLAALWKAERDLVLGDRRADQYIIGADKRAYGIDYQFKGDVSRWERTNDSINEALVAIPELRNIFENEIESDKNSIKSLLKKIFRS